MTKRGHMYKFIDNKTLRTELRNKAEHIIFSLQKELKQYFTFSYKLIGSGETRLMTVNGKDNSIDLDYNLLLQRDKRQLASNPKMIKELFLKSLKKICGKNSKVSDSTQVITCNLGNIGKYKFSIDFAILYEGNDCFFYKIVNDKTYQPTRYIWNKVPQSKNFEEKFRVVKQECWEDLKKRYLEKKNRNLWLNSKKTSFSLLIETINELI